MTANSPAAPGPTATPYALIGGAAVVRRITERFYDLMDESPDVRELRAMHEGDLTPMRQKLFEFMSGWLGGPNLYFERSDRKCMGSVHAAFKIGPAERDQWLGCMHRAMADAGVEASMLEKVDAALFRMADMMRSKD